MAGGEGDPGSAAVEETKRYYQERSKEYGDWTGRTGEPEGDSRPDQSFYDEAGMLIDAVRGSGLGGEVLELACGPGIWTEEVAKLASSVTALDASEGMIARARERLRSFPGVEFVVADFYRWSPPRPYDGVTFSFFVSHVPKERLGEFAARAVGCLSEGGRLFFVDQRWEARGGETYEGRGGEVVRRTLADGREFRVVKRYYLPPELKEAFLQAGVTLDFGFTPTHFFWASGVKA